ncbi:MAG: hypothetical protein HYT76_02665 [Deltaproteobacteria bacterium]|nr:hypothetical protein [Deltaproteobacteria bacterium]
MRSLIHWILSSIATLLWLTPALLLCRLAPKKSERLLKKWAETQLKIFGIEVTVEDRNKGQYNSPPYLYLLLNQTSLSETLIVNHVISEECYVLMNFGYALLPFIGWLTWLRGGVRSKSFFAKRYQR